MSKCIIMKEKYFKKEGLIAFRLWVFALVLDELKKNPNKEKAAALRDRVVEFSESAWVSAKGTKEERADIQSLIDDLTVLAI